MRSCRLDSAFPYAPPTRFRRSHLYHRTYLIVYSSFFGCPLIFVPSARSLRFTSSFPSVDVLSTNAFLYVRLCVLVRPIDTLPYVPPIRFRAFCQRFPVRSTSGFPSIPPVRSLASRSCVSIPFVSASHPFPHFIISVVYF